MRRLIIAAFFLFPHILSAQSIADFLNYHFHTNLVSSSNPQKPMLAFVDNYQGVRNLYVLQSPAGEPMPLTSYAEDDGQALGGVSFTDSMVYYVRGGAPNRKGEFPNPTSDAEGAERAIYKVPLQGDAAPQWIAKGHHPIPFENGLLFLRKGSVYVKMGTAEPTQLFEMRGNVGAPRLSPDQSKLAFISRRGDHAFASIYHFADSSIQVLDPSVDTDSDLVWSPDGKQLAFLRRPQDQSFLFTPKRTGLPFSIKIYDLDKQAITHTWTAEKGTGSVYQSISADNQLLWMASGHLVFPWEREGWTQLYGWLPGDQAPKLLTPGAFEVQFVSLSPGGSSIVFSSNQNDINRQHIWQIDGQLKLTQLTSGSTIEWSPVVSGGQVYCLGSGGREPASVKRVANGKLTRMKGSPDYLSQQLVEPEEITYTAVDGMVIHGQLFKPADLKDKDQRPAVIFMHGGSRRQMLAGFHHLSYYHYMYAMNQFLASKGYVVLAINYRSGIGYGMEFREAINYGAQGASEFNDVLGAGLYLKGLSFVDKRREDCTVDLIGGYLTALGLSRASDLFAAGVDIHGVMDWNVIINGFNPDYNPLTHPEFAELAYESSPISSMETWRSPVLLIHGDDDRNVPFSETVDKIEQLRKNDVYFEQLVFPDEVHGFLLHDNWQKAFEATYNFFERKMK